MDKQAIIYPYHGQLLSHRKEYNDKHNNTDGCQMHYAKGKKPYSKAYGLYDSIYVIF